MGKINDYTRKFSGRLAGATIGELAKRLDYTVDSLTDRISLVEEICQHEFFVEYFDVRDKTVVDHNYYMNGCDDKLEELKNERDALVKEANQCIIQYKKTRDMELIERNESLKSQALYIDEQIEELKAQKEKAKLNVAERIYFNVHPKCYSEVYAGDPLGADNNVCQALERMADYILKLDSEYQGITEYKQKQINEREASLDEMLEHAQVSEEDYSFNGEKFRGNYKLEIKQKIFQEDYKITKVDKKCKRVSFHKQRIESLGQIKQTLDALRGGRTNNTNYRLNKLIGELERDAVIVKDAYNGTIYFKRVMKDTCDMQEFLIDFREVEHIKALLECSPSSQKWYGTTSISLEQYLHDIKYKISEDDWNTLQFIRECSNIAYLDLYGETGESRENVNTSITRIAKLIYKHHMDISNEIWHMNRVYSYWKRCSKCGEYKNHHEFNSDTTRIDGFFPYCKECMSKIR